MAIAKTKTIEKFITRKQFITFGVVSTGQRLSGTLVIMEISFNQN